MKWMTEAMQRPPRFLVADYSGLTFKELSQLLAERLDHLRQQYPDLVAEPVIISLDYPTTSLTPDSFRHLEDYDAPIIAPEARNRIISWGPQGLWPIAPAFSQECVQRSLMRVAIARVCIRCILPGVSNLSSRCGGFFYGLRAAFSE